MSTAFTSGNSARSCGSPAKPPVSDERSPELPTSPSDYCPARRTYVTVASLNTMSGQSKNCTMENQSHINVASNGTNDESHDLIECLVNKEFSETTDLRNPLSAQSTNSFAGGDSFPLSPALNYAFYPEDSFSAAQSSVMSLSSNSFASIASPTCKDEKELSPDHKSVESSSAKHPTAAEQAKASQECLEVGEYYQGHETGMHQFYLPEAFPTISTADDSSIRVPQSIQKTDVPLPSKFFGVDCPSEELLSLLLRKDQQQGRVMGLNTEEQQDSSGHASMQNFLDPLGTNLSATRKVFMTGNTHTVRPSPAVRYENKDCIVSEFSRLWKGNKCLEPQEVSDRPGRQTQDSRTHIPISVGSTEREDIVSERSKNPHNSHAIVLDEESMFKDLATAWDLDVTEESAAERHGRAARDKQRPDYLIENRYSTSLCPSSQNLQMPENYPEDCTFPNNYGSNSSPTGIGPSGFIGRRRSFPGGDVGVVDFTQDRKHFRFCVGGLAENQDTARQRRYSGPFALPPLPSEEALNAHDVWSWHGADSCMPDMSGAPYLEGPCSQMSSFQASDLSAEQAARTPTDLNTSGKHDTSTTSSRSGVLAKYTLIVNVPPMTTRQDLHMCFSAFGKVELTVVVCDKDHRHPHREWTATSGYAFVRFSSSSEAAAAVAAAAVGGIRMRGSRIRATWAKKDSLAKHSSTSDLSCVSCSGSMGTGEATAGTNSVRVVVRYRMVFDTSKGCPGGDTVSEGDCGLFIPYTRQRVWVVLFLANMRARLCI